MNPLLITAALLITGVASATDFHVSPTGDDGNTGLGAGDDQALRTIQAGVNKLQPGDTLLIHGGVYRESVTFPASGAEGRPWMVISSSAPLMVMVTRPLSVRLVLSMTV